MDLRVRCFHLLKIKIGINFIDNSLTETKSLVTIIAVFMDGNGGACPGLMI